MWDIFLNIASQTQSVILIKSLSLLTKEAQISTQLGLARISARWLGFWLDNLDLSLAWLDHCSMAQI